MKNNQPSDPLDRLLEQQPLPEAPAWFEARVMARVRQERERGWRIRLSEWLAGEGVGEWLRPALVSGALALVVAFAISSSQRNVASDEVSGQSINSALEAYASYSEQNSSWNIAAY